MVDIYQEIKKHLPKRTIDAILYIPSAIVTILGGFLLFFHKAETTIAIILAVFYGIYLFLFLVILVWREHVYARKSRYAEAMSSLHMCLHTLRDTFHIANTDNHKQNKSLILENLKQTLSHFSQVFSVITGAHCRACIKMLYFDGDTHNPHENNFFVKTLIRSEDGFTFNISDKYKKDWLTENTDFLKLWRTQGKIFDCNDLSKLHIYKNSHWPDDPKEREDYIKQKKYDYVSTLVWPIRKKEANGNPLLIGFLCVDSKTHGIFETRYDFEAGALFADSLFIMLKTYQDSGYDAI